jgi:methionyl aminopeptidase
VIVRKSGAELEQMRAAGDVVAEALALLARHVRPGVTTAELDRLADEHIRSRGGVPTFKGYRGYPAAICTSPNDVIVHGIPGPYAAEEGDILSVDVGVTLGGFVADSAVTLPVGTISSEAQRLIDTCRAALAAGIDRVGDISAAVQSVVEAAGFAVVRSLVGHGVGRSMHEDPQIPNFGLPGRGAPLAPGMTLAIEPMITAGEAEIVLEDDGWTITTVDGSLAAHCEHTVAVTADGPPDILTLGSAAQRVAEVAPAGASGSEVRLLQ